ncbi:MAG: hypothetical protein JSS29_14995 [Proteobacteria bacterium]|nr:hypothetical protein [Pseudomonadota bacterium]
MALILPLLALRLLIPVGFMPMAGMGGGFALALCPDGGPVAMMSGHAGHHMHHEHPGPPGSSGGEHHLPCFFAASAAPALSSDSGAGLAALPEIAGGLPARQALAHVPVSIVRAQLARAPPANV